MNIVYKFGLAKVSGKIIACKHFFCSCRSFDHFIFIIDCIQFKWERNIAKRDTCIVTKWKRNWNWKRRRKVKWTWVYGEQKAFWLKDDVHVATHLWILYDFECEWREKRTIVFIANACGNNILRCIIQGMFIYKMSM